MRCPTSRDWCGRSAFAILPSGSRSSHRSAPTPGTGCSPVAGRPSCTRSSRSTARATARRPPRATCCSTYGANRWTSASSWPASSSTAMAGSITVVDEVHGFRFFDNRDLLGFVDGTENPDGPLAKQRHGDRRRGSRVRRLLLCARAEVRPRHGGVGVAVGHRAGAGDRAHQARGHRDGRRRQAGQLPHRAERHRPTTTATSCKIVRHNMPFGEIGKGEFGTYFIGYSRTAGGHRADADATCSSATRRATPTASWISPPRSPAGSSSPRSSTSSMTHRRFRIREPEEAATSSHAPRPSPQTARWGSAA